MERTDDPDIRKSLRSSARSQEQLQKPKIILCAVRSLPYSVSLSGNMSDQLDRDQINLPRCTAPRAPPDPFAFCKMGMLTSIQNHIFQVERPPFMNLHKMPYAVMCDPAKP